MYVSDVNTKRLATDARFPIHLACRRICEFQFCAFDSCSATKTGALYVCIHFEYLMPNGNKKLTWRLEGERSWVNEEKL